MSGNPGKSHSTKGVPQLAQDGYMTKMAPKPDSVQGGYQPTAGQGTSTAPASVPKQPSSVQPPNR